MLIRFYCVAALLTVGLVSTVVCAQEAQKNPAMSGVVLMYHRFGDDRYPPTNTTIEQLEDHIQALKAGGHAVVPLADIVSAQRGLTILPPKSIAITVDDAYRSFLMEGWPRFKAAGFPVTLFVSTAASDGNFSDNLSWDEIRALEREGVSIGAHSQNHDHLPTISAEDVTQDIASMTTAFVRELGAVPKLYAYPYGEAGLPDMDAVRAAGFLAAFGQQSGAIGPDSDPFYLPRFALNEAYGGADRFRLIIDSLPLPVTDVSPREPVLRHKVQAFHLTLETVPQNISDLTCYGPQGRLLDTKLDANRITITPDLPFPIGRGRFNCTLPAATDQHSGRWHWFGWQVISGLKTEGVDVHPRYH